MFNRKTKNQKSHTNHRPHLPLTLLALLVIHEIAHATEANVMAPEMVIPFSDYIDLSLSDFQLNANVAFENIEVQMSVHVAETETSSSDSDDFNAEAEQLDNMLFVSPENQDTPIDETVAEQTSQEEDIQVSESRTTGGDDNTTGGSSLSKGLLLGLATLAGGTGLAISGSGGDSSSDSAAIPTPTPAPTPSSIFSIDSHSTDEMTTGSSTSLIIDRTGDTSVASQVKVIFNLDPKGETNLSDIQVFTSGSKTPLTLISDGDDQYHVIINFAANSVQETLSIHSVSGLQTDRFFGVEIRAVNPTDSVDADHDTLNEWIIATAKPYDIVITEIMNSTFSGVGIPSNVPASGWIEVYNTTNHDIDLKDWHLEAGGQVDYTVDGTNTLIQAGHYALLSNKDISTLKDGQGDAIQNIFVKDFVSYTLVPNLIAIMDANNQQINAVDLTDPSFAPLISATRQPTSLELKLSVFANDIAENHDADDWEVSPLSYYHAVVKNGSIVLKGSPGKEIASIPVNTLHVGDLKFTEFMADPNASSPEWLEIQNTTANIIDLKGLTFSASSGASFTIADDVYIQAGQYFALGAGTPSFIGGPYNVAYVYSNFQFTSGDTLSMQAGNFNEQGPIISSLKGYSYELAPSGQWRETVASIYDFVKDHGTPGIANPDSTSSSTFSIADSATTLNTLTLHDGASAMVTVTRTGDINYSSSVDVNFYIGAQLPLDDIKFFLQGDSTPVTPNGNGGYSTTLSFTAGEAQKELSIHSIGAAITSNQSFTIAITSSDPVDQNHQSVTGTITNSAPAFDANGDLVPGALAITEIMPGKTSAFNNGWIEVYNTTHQDIDLAGMHLLAGGKDFTIGGQNTFLHAGDYAVIAGQSSDLFALRMAVDARDNPIQVIDVQQVVYDLTQSITIQDKNYNLIDQVEAFDSSFLQQLQTHSHSAEITPHVFNSGAIAANNDSVTSWGYAPQTYTFYGSPGMGLSVVPSDILSGGELKITEYMAAPKQQEPQWFEIQNTTNETIALKGLTFMSHEGSFTILEETYIEAKQYLALSSSALTNVKNNYVYDSSGFHFGNDDTLSLLDLHAASAKTLDSVEHTLSTPGQSAYWDGASWHLSDVTTPTYDTLNDHGTPGDPNNFNHHI